MVSERQKSALYQKEALERSEKASCTASGAASLAQSHTAVADITTASSAAWLTLYIVLQLLDLFRVVEALQSCNTEETRAFISASSNGTPKFTMPKAYQGRKPLQRVCWDGYLNSEYRR